METHDGVEAAADDPKQSSEVSLVEGPVPPAREHLALSSQERGETLTLARIAPQDPANEDNGRFVLDWLVGDTTAADRRLRREALARLEFYLIEKQEPLPWTYVLHHCNTASNLYAAERGDVFWTFSPSPRSAPPS